MPCFHKMDKWSLSRSTFKPTSGCEAICLPTSSNAASLTDIAESQNLPSTATWTRLSPNTSGSASTIILTCHHHTHGKTYFININEKCITLFQITLTTSCKNFSLTARKALALITGEFSLKLAWKENM